VVEGESLLFQVRSKRREVLGDVAVDVDDGVRQVAADLGRGTAHLAA